MTLEQPGLGSDPPNGLGRERGATDFVPKKIIFFLKKRRKGFVNRSL